MIALAVDLTTTGLPFRQALAKIAPLGVRGVQIDPVGELAADELTGTARRELRTLLRSYNLEISALRCPLRHGIDVAQDFEGRLARIKSALQLAVDLRAPRVILPLPRIPSKPSPILDAALTELGRAGDHLGCLLGLEVGLDRSESVQKYLSRFEYESLQITYDPANLLLNGHDPLAELGLLTGRVVAVHARDARRATFSGVGQEAAVGQGDLDWLSILALLGAMDYRGFLCLEREAGTQRWADTAAGVAYLQRFLPTTR